MQRYYPLERLFNIEEGYRRVFKIDQHRLLLQQVGGEPFITEANCPHRGHPLEFSDRYADQTLRCPLHGYRFRLRDGQWLQGGGEPCRSLRCYEVIYRDGWLGVLLDN